MKYGKNCKAYYLDTGTRASWGTLDPDTGVVTGAAPGNLVEVDSVKEITIGFETVSDDVTIRRSVGVQLEAAVLMKWGLELTLQYEPDSAFWVALRTAYLTLGSIAMCALDGPSDVAGSQGPWCDYAVLDFPREEQMEKAMFQKIKLAPTISAVGPEYVVVS